MTSPAATGSPGRRPPRDSGCCREDPHGERPALPVSDSLGGTGGPSEAARDRISRVLGKGEAATGEVMLFVGCVFDHVFPEVGRAAFETVKASGKSVAVFRDAACCGLPAMVSGTAGPRRSAPRRMSAACGRGARDDRLPLRILSAHVQEERIFPAPEGNPRARGRGLRRGPRGGLRELPTLLGGSRPAPDPPPGRRSARSGTRPVPPVGDAGKGPEAREVLSRAVGPAFAEMAGADLCCGYGGRSTCATTRPRRGSGEQGDVAARGGTKVISTACSGCVLQMRDMVARTDPSLRVVHIAELVRQALFRK